MTAKDGHGWQQRRGDDVTNEELERKAQIATTLLSILNALRPLSPIARLEVLAETAIGIGAYDIAEATCRRLKGMSPESATPTGIADKP